MPEIIEQGYLSLPPTEKPAPAILVLPAWWGLNSFFRQFCDRLTQAGFVAFATDLYGGKVAETVEQATALRDGLDDAKIGALLHSSVEALRRHPRADGQPIGLIGFSLGAFLALTLFKEIPDQIRAQVIFYGTYPATYPAARTAVMAHFAETDEYEPLSDQQAFENALKAAGIDTTFYIYPGTEHWFFESDQPNAYNADVAQLAWERTLAFLNKHLKGVE